MKMLSKYFFGVLFSVSCTHAFAQISDTKQSLFAAYPATINITKVSLDELLQTKPGATVSSALSTNFTFEGTVISNITKYNTMHTVMIRATQNPESVFQITKIQNKENTFSYVGRILNNNAADGYEIKNKNGEYFLQKFETAQILETCKF